MSLRPLLLAFGTLTVLRVPLGGSVSGADLQASAAWYPLAGLAVGAVPAAVLALPVPALPRAAAALACWIVVTGALHLDGWADCCDAAFAPGRTREQRLALLKDPHLGTFGAAGLVMLLLAKWSALVSVPAWAPLLAAPVARWAMVAVLGAFPPARADGLGAAFGGRAPLGLATAVLAVALLPLAALPGWPRWGGAALLAGVAAAAFTARFLASRFGGATGDVCGATGEMAEAVILLALAAAWP